eukprot:m.128688 g.128688  ORF g.128688 m.128688 type:complete len:197 (+) comp9453_c1_seq3:2221-2811(+)
MFSLLSGLWQYLTQMEEYSVLIVGLDDAGKTTLFEQLKVKFKPKYSMKKKIIPTIGQNVTSIMHEHVRLVFWDVGGQGDLQQLWENYYKEAHGIIYVVDAANEGRLDESHNVFGKLLSNRELEGVPLLILCNKQDTEGAMTTDEVKRTFNRSAHKLGLRDCKVIGASALNGDHILESADWLVDKMKSNKDRLPVVK